MNNWNDYKNKLNGNIILIGFMGAGKSSVSAYLNEKLGLEVIEMDQEIVEREGMSIADIFAVHGEEYFRNLETNLLIEMQTKNNVVVSCGGGAAMRACNVVEMKKNGKVVLLTARPETIYERVKDSTERPLLNGNMNVEYIAGLMDKRRDKYEAAADIIIYTDNKDLETICEELLEKFIED